MDRDTSASEESESEFFADNLSHCSDESDIDDYFKLGGYESSEEEEDDDQQRLLTSTSPDLVGDREWSSTDDPPGTEQFLGRPGINTEHVPRSAADAVNLFMDDNFFAFLVEESNRYYHQNADGLKANEKSLEWEDITIREMKKFLGLILLMAVIEKDKRENFWNWDSKTDISIFPQTMSRDRFRQIWRAWHFNNNEDVRDESDKLCKVRPLLNFFVSKFREVYKPMQQLRLDDGILPWRRKSFLKVYYAGDLISYGIVMRMVRESATGYVCNLEMYCGEEMGPRETIETVLSPFTGVWHHLYTNYHYNSVGGSEKLLEKQIRICGTLRKKRELPECLKQASLKKGETMFRRKGDVLVLVWQSGERVFLISSIHSANMKRSRIIFKPNALIDYRRYRKVVDKTSEYLYYYSFLFKTSKWTKWVALNLINRAFFNSYVVYNSTNQAERKNYHIFLRNVALHWVTDGHEEQIPWLVTGARAKSLIHVVVPATYDNVLRHCHVCAARKLPSKTRYMCKVCKVPLHKGKCFERYHKQKRL